MQIRNSLHRKAIWKGIKDLLKEETLEELMQKKQETEISSFFFPWDRTSWNHEETSSRRGNKRRKIESKFKHIITYV